MRSRGFSLVELSIVLVILGLLVGGILSGQSLIEAARIRKQLSEFEKLNTAALTYRAKYDSIPGDDPHSTLYFTNIPNGNGNGRLDPFATNYFCQYGVESCVFWGALYQAKLWHFNADTTTPEATADRQCGNGARYPCFMERGTVGYVIETTADATGFAAANSKHHISFVSDSKGGTASWYGGSYIYGYAAMSPDESQLFDRKIDDGKPLSGAFVARSNHHPQYRSALATPGGGSVGDSCVSTSTGNPYNTGSAIECVVTLDTQF